EMQARFAGESKVLVAQTETGDQPDREICGHIGEFGRERNEDRHQVEFGHFGPLDAEGPMLDQDCAGIRNTLRNAAGERPNECESARAGWSLDDALKDWARKFLARGEVTPDSTRELRGRQSFRHGAEFLGREADEVAEN